MIPMRVTAKNIPTKELMRLQKELPHTANKILKDISSRAEVYAQSIAPTDTGRLKSTIETKQVNQYSFDLKIGPVPRGKGSKESYDYYQEYGFRPHYVHRSMWMGSKWTSSDDFAYVRKNTPVIWPTYREFLTPDNVNSMVIKHVNTLMQKAVL